MLIKDLLVTEAPEGSSNACVHLGGCETLTYADPFKSLLFGVFKYFYFILMPPKDNMILTGL